MLTLTLLNWQVRIVGNHYDAFTEIDFSRYDDREGMTLVRPVGKRPMQFLTDIKDGDWLVFNNLTFKKRPGKITFELQALNPGGVLEMRRGSLQGELLASCTIQSTNGEWTKQSFEVKKLRKKEKVYFVFGGSNKSLSIKNFIFE